MNRPDQAGIGATQRAGERLTDKGTWLLVLSSLFLIWVAYLMIMVGGASS